MKTKVYINGIGSISRLDINNIVKESIIEPDYKELIPAMKLRRMSKVMRMSNFSALMALNNANVDSTDTINIATGYGCLTDTEKFVSTLLDNNEEFANPSAFINSTHNTLAGNLAILLSAKGQNFTFVHANNSFENALLDICIGIEENSFTDALVGGVDEKIEILETVLSNKEDNIGEGASFLYITKEKENSSLAEIASIKVDNSGLELNELVDDFLKENSLDINDIDLILSDSNEFQKPTINYKQITGEYPTAVAFACVLATNIINTQKMPAFVTEKVDDISNILIVSSYNKRSKSLILLSKI